jgi:hypothetical protein
MTGTPLGQKPHGVGHLGPAFELDRRTAGLGQNARCGPERLLARFLIAAERHVDNHQSAGGTAHDGRTVGDHHVDGDRQGAVEPVDHHPHRSPDQQKIDMRIEQVGDRRGGRQRR